MDLRWSLLGLVAFALFVKISRSKDRPASPNNKNNMDLSKPQVGASSSSSSSPSSTHSFTHDVFLSFRGLDTRNNFTSHLHSNLVNKGIRTYIDNDLTRGEDITKELLEAIGGSRISIVVFSANYASSKWCLDELVEIFECEESNQQIVYPIFYKVEPWEIRYQKGQVGKAIARLSKHKDNLEKMDSWKAALRKAADLSGWQIKDGGHEANVIDEIVKHISTKIMRCTPLNVATHPVGIEFSVKDILKLLNVGQDKPHMVGIWGIGGIGKSTLAKAVYNSISNKFEHSCFLANVREESSSSGGLVKLQNNFLKNIERNPPNVENVAKGITLLKQKLSQKKVLLVIDDVDCLGQLEALAAESGWFGPGSKIIITTRDTNCVSPDSTYEVKELNHEDASKLFNCYAFKGDICPDGFFELATEVIHYAKGKFRILLVLEVLGSDLCSKKDKDVWKAALEYYRRCPNKDIQKILQRSYDGLHDQIQEVFLHIACFFKGHEKSYVIDVLQSCDLPKYALEVLVEKALIKIEKNDWIWMHDLIEDMGKEIVRQESPEIGKCSRLWLHEDIREVLEENTGTDKIKAIVLGRGVWNSQSIQLDGGSFTNLKNLQIFEVNGDEMLSGESVDYLPNQLRVLDWSCCSLRSLPVKLTALLTLFFSCAKSEEFQVTFPASAPLPNWFTCRQDAKLDVNGKVINKEHEFCIEIPQNSNWDNKGLALCIQSYSDKPDFPPFLTHLVHINGIKFDENLMSRDEEVWVHYIPFVTVKKRLSESGISSPDMFRVMVRLKEIFIDTERPFGVSWGVHLIEDLEGEGG
ncbi:disease resistance protein RPV1-like [Rosa rugosa]|uniref:disease resistance protein RPV1-like n=1 Tax=Rosa rugosa TaxID=74645 RepID=UPI002B4069AB|nr:disease resistance protein RPV1-like [Rosa rugosa]